VLAYSRIAINIVRVLGALIIGTPYLTVSWPVLLVADVCMT